MVSLKETVTTSRVLDSNAVDLATAHSHFSKLAFETDPSDVYMDLQNGVTSIIVIDARSSEAYAKGHVPGSISLPYRKIDNTTIASLARDKVLVTYCEGVFCNASTKAAAKLTALGFKVKEMLDGLDGWRREGYPVEMGVGPVKLQTNAE